MNNSPDTYTDQDIRCNLFRSRYILFPCKMKSILKVQFFLRNINGFSIFNVFLYFIFKV